MIPNCLNSNSGFLTTIPHDFVIAAIAKELEILKLKLQYTSHNADFIDDRQQLYYYLNELIHNLTVINRGLPPLPTEMEIFDSDDDEI
jgi:hypothetical protein